MLYVTAKIPPFYLLWLKFLRRTEFISCDKVATGYRIDTLSAHAQTLLSCLKYTVVDRLERYLIINVKNCSLYKR